MPADAAAQRLLGCLLVRMLEDGTRLSGRIVETEAYMGSEDEASHAVGGRRTAKNEQMYAAPNTAYIYFTYGMHHCMNVSCAAKDDPQAVLIRALEPIDGVERMQELRTAGRNLKKPLTERDLCSGPGKLCQALALDRSLDGHNMNASKTLWIERGEAVQECDILTGPRVGIADRGEWTHKHFRWCVAGNRHVSRPLPKKA